MHKICINIIKNRRKGNYFSTEAYLLPISTSLLNIKVNLTYGKRLHSCVRNIHKDIFKPRRYLCNKSSVKGSVMAENANNSNGQDNGGKPKLSRQLTSNFDKMLNVDYNTNEEEYNYGAVDEPYESSDSEDTPVIRLDDDNGIKLSFKTGVATDIGGGHENQDKYMCFKAGDNNEHLIMAVFDGHGRELGELAATAAKEWMQNELNKVEVLNALSQNPKKVFDEIFEGAHQYIKDVFRKHVEDLGDWDVVESQQGYLMKRQKPGIQHLANNFYQLFETNVHGGSTATVVVILNSKRLLVANVGDSTAVIGALDSSGKVLFKELSSEHSPESLDEFKRVKKCTKPDVSLLSNDKSTLRFVYDVIENSQIPTPKYNCPPIFAVNHETGVCRKTSLVGSYYKNVRSEWATLVTTPPEAKFQDALAFTRSLGDLHLHVYGVTHEPEVQEYDLTRLHQQATEQSILSNSSESPSSILLVCTDGVWDNWRFEDILRYMLGSETLKKTQQDTSHSAQVLTDEMMTENLKLARKYFGSQADNMTGVVCVINSST